MADTIVEVVRTVRLSLPPDLSHAEARKAGEETGRSWVPGNAVPGPWDRCRADVISMGDGGDDD